MSQVVMSRIVVVLVAALLLAGCGGGDSGDAEAPAAGQAGGPAEGLAEGLAQGEPAAAPREIIYTASLVVRTDDVLAAADQAVAITEDLGGFVDSADREREPRPLALLQLRVPSDRFSEALDRLGELGDVRREELAASDVTAEVVDLETRIASAETSIERLQELLAEAGSTEALVQIENALAQRQSELEAALGQLRVLQDEVDLSTIDLTLAEPGDPQISDDVPGFLRGLRGGFVALVNFLQWLVTVAGALLPWALFFGAIAFGLVRLVRWRRARRPPRPPRQEAVPWPGPPAAGPHLPPPPQSPPHDETAAG